MRGEDNTHQFVNYDHGAIIIILRENLDGGKKTMKRRAFQRRNGEKKIYLEKLSYRHYTALV